MKRILFFCGLILALLLLSGCEYSCDEEKLTVSSFVSAPLYECESRGLQMPCEKLSKYLSPAGKCWNSELGNKICREGWQPVKKKEESLPVKRLSFKTKSVLCHPPPKYSCEEKV